MPHPGMGRRSRRPICPQSPPCRPLRRCGRRTRTCGPPPPPPSQCSGHPPVPLPPPPAPVCHRILWCRAFRPRLRTEFRQGKMRWSGFFVPTNDIQAGCSKIHSRFFKSKLRARDNLVRTAMLAQDAVYPSLPVSCHSLPRPHSDLPYITPFCSDRFHFGQDDALCAISCDARKLTPVAVFSPRFFSCCFCM